MSGGRSPRHAQNPLSGERRKTISITHHALSPPPSHHHLYIIHLINWLQRFYCITMSLEIPYYWAEKWRKAMIYYYNNLIGRRAAYRAVSERQWTPAERRKNGTWTVWGRLVNIGMALAGFLLSILRPSAFSSPLPLPPPPPLSDRPPSRTLTECSSGAPSRTVENVATFWHVKKLCATLSVLQRPPMTTNDLQRSSGAPLATYNVLQRSSVLCPFSWTLDKLCPERCNETGLHLRQFSTLMVI